MKSISKIAARFALSASLFASGALYAAPKNAPIPVDLFVMSLCPFGVQAENALLPAVKSLGKSVDLNLYFIANEVPPAEAGGKNTFRALHGQPEVDENIRQLCVEKHHPKKYMDYILERNKNYKSPEWKEAAQRIGLDTAKIDGCVTGEEGFALHAENIKVSAERQANASPTIYVGGQKYNGPRGIKSFTLSLCQALEAQGAALPDACREAASLPDDPASAGANCGPNGAPAAGAPAVSNVPINIQAVYDDSCSFCGPTLVEALQRQHPKAKITSHAASSKEGRALIRQYEPEALPLYVMDKQVELDPNFKEVIKSLYAKQGDGYVVVPGPGTYRPSVRLTRERIPRHIDVFVEGLSPFTAQAEGELLRFLRDTEVKDLTFSFHYILQETAKADSKKDAPSKRRAASVKEIDSVSMGPLTGARGAPEVQESLRQVCLFQKASIGTFFAYLDCRSQNLQDMSRGDTCLQMDQAVKDCITGGEGEKLLRDDARLARELGIASGPVFLWENRYGPFGWNEMDWKGLIDPSPRRSSGGK